jgi:hypothetical protein
MIEPPNDETRQLIETLVDFRFDLEVYLIETHLNEVTLQPKLQAGIGHLLADIQTILSDLKAL